MTRGGRWALGLGSVTLLALVAAVAAARHADVTAGSPIEPGGGWTVVWLAGVVGSFAAFLLALFAVARRETRLRAAIVLAIAIQLAPLAAPLLLSRDVYLYWAFGRLQTEYAQDPFADRPSSRPNDPAVRLMGDDWRDYPLPYGPGFALVTAGHAAVAGDDPETATWLYKALAAAAMLGVVGLVATLAPRPAFAVALVGWNPLLALHFAGGGHNDALMMIPVLGALLLTRRAREQLAGAAWALAFAIKWVPLVWVPLRALAARRAGRPLGLWGLVGGLALVVVANALLYDGTLADTKSMIANQADRVTSISGPYWLTELGLPRRVATGALLLGFATAYLWLLREARRGRPRLALAGALLLVAVPALQPWYVLWPLSLAAIDEDRTARVLALALCVYFLRDPLPL